MTTPEEFLARITSIQGVIEALDPFFEIAAAIRGRFLEAGFSQESAEALTVMFVQQAIMPYVGPEKEVTDGSDG